jgi:hypothetical protein
MQKGEGKKRKAGSGKGGSLFADYPGVVALWLPNQGLGSLGTILIIVLIVFLLGGGGWYWRGRG